MSPEIKIAKERNTFVSEYKIHPNALLGIKIKESFIEKQYTLEEGWFSKYKINDTAYQLVIVAEEYFESDDGTYETEWKLDEFIFKSSKSIYKTINFNEIKDTVFLNFVPLKSEIKKIDCYLVKKKP